MTFFPVIQFRGVFHSTRRDGRKVTQRKWRLVFATKPRLRPLPWPRFSWHSVPGLSVRARCLRGRQFSTLQSQRRKSLALFTGVPVPGGCCGAGDQCHSGAKFLSLVRPSSSTYASQSRRGKGRGRLSRGPGSGIGKCRPGPLAEPPFRGPRAWQSGVGTQRKRVLRTPQDGAGGGAGRVPAAGPCRTRFCPSSSLRQK